MCPRTGSGEREGHGDADDAGGEPEKLDVHDAGADHVAGAVGE